MAPQGFAHFVWGCVFEKVGNHNQALRACGSMESRYAQHLEQNRGNEFVTFCRGSKLLGGHIVLKSKHFFLRMFTNDLLIYVNF